MGVLARDSGSSWDSQGLGGSGARRSVGWGGEFSPGVASARNGWERGGMLKSPCRRCFAASLAGTVPGWGRRGLTRRGEAQGMVKNVPASSQGAFPPLFPQPLLLQKRKSHRLLLEKMGGPVTRGRTRLLVLSFLMSLFFFLFRHFNRGD